MKTLLSLTLFLFALPPDGITIPAGQGVVGASPTEIAKQLSGTTARVQWYADESPQRNVKLDSFIIDRTEVTNSRYKRQLPDHTFPPNLAEHPVVNVTFAEAEKFCADVGGALPTEEQWERAARGKDGLIYPWGDKFDETAGVYSGSAGGDNRLKIGSYDLEVSSSRALGGTRPAGSLSKGASPFGVLDMAGNVWEWVAGYYDQTRGLRLLKGGSWLTPSVSLRASTRLGDVGVKRYNDFGFRCVYEVAP